jgi:hypothetical protein
VHAAPRRQWCVYVDEALTAWSMQALSRVTPLLERERMIPTGGFPWRGPLFQYIFSLVHSLLTTSFESVHTRVNHIAVVACQCASLGAILPHEAYNTLQIATELDRAFSRSRTMLMNSWYMPKRDESERRLRQSLYVQTCEIMGRVWSVNSAGRHFHRTDDRTTKS